MAENIRKRQNLLGQIEDEKAAPSSAQLKMWSGRRETLEQVARALADGKWIRAADLMNKLGAEIYRLGWTDLDASG
ncbi:MAG TPA: hypothetical protein VGZ32_21500 [Actinocrinis sp.]|uniref:hypothetical protein n=1 Tax=Actinocrinis sp. TaxID=1920516 RepID=UPI002DDDA2F3|nr:hypothetical protein [Actinocrinis sp.]HEV3172936.1 hypothetical protein [Actinocrinis sp.]